MVESEPLPIEVKSALDAWAGCVAGTIPVEAYRAAVLGAGFTEVEVEVTHTFGPGEAGLPAGSGQNAIAHIRGGKPFKTGQQKSTGERSGAFGFLVWEALKKQHPPGPLALG